MGEKRRYLTASGILLISVFLIISGIFRGEPLTVFQKAVVICMECIGIG